MQRGSTAVGVVTAAAAFAHGAGAYDLANSVGVTHWNPCYWNPHYQPPLPSLLDGAATLGELGTSAIKVTVNSLKENYPWHTEWDLSQFTDLKSELEHPYFKSIFTNSIPGHPTNFKTYVLVAYACNQFGCQNNVNYWCGNFTAADEARETKQFHDATAYLLQTYAGTGKRFIYQHWEGDWSARCGSYDGSQPVEQRVSQNMVRWLAARQAGVTAARRAFCVSRLAAANGLDCETSSERNILDAAGVEILHAAEVNRVLDSIDGTPAGKTNLVMSVVPNVALDMVSYSSYDSMGTTRFGEALDFIATQHKPTSASPLADSAVYIGEYGVAQNEKPPEVLQDVTKNVLAFAFSKGARGARRAAHAMFWELYDNEVLTGGQYTGRCYDTPVLDNSKLAGFYLMRPDGSLSWAWDFLRGVINGSQPVPPAPAQELVV